MSYVVICQFMLEDESLRKIKLQLEPKRYGISQETERSSGIYVAARMVGVERHTWKMCFCLDGQTA